MVEPVNLARRRAGAVFARASGLLSQGPAGLHLPAHGVADPPGLGLLLRGQDGVELQHQGVVFQQGLDKIMREAKEGFMRQVNSLPPLQAAVLYVMAQTGAKYAPFRPLTVQMYAEICNKIAVDEPRVETSSIQYALESLRTKMLIWSSSRGVYAIEDSQHAAWLVEDAQEQGLFVPGDQDQ